MKFSIEKHELRKGLSRIQAIVEKRNSMPILANVLMEATGKAESGSLELAATDLEVGIRGSYTADVASEGGLTASYEKFIIDAEMIQMMVEADYEKLKAG